MKFKQLFLLLMVTLACATTSCQKEEGLEPLDIYYVSIADRTLDVDLSTDLVYGELRIPINVETSPNTYHIIELNTITVADQTTAIYNVHYCFDVPPGHFNKQKVLLEKDSSTGKFFVRLHVSDEHLTKPETLTISFPQLKEGLSLKPNGREILDTVTITLRKTK